MLWVVFTGFDALFILQQDNYFRSHPQLSLLSFIFLLQFFQLLNMYYFLHSIQ